MMAAFYRLLFAIITCVAFTRCSEDCVFNVKHGENYLQFDFNSFKDLKTTNFTKSSDIYSLNIKLCNSDELKTTCDGIRSKICLINKNHQFDLGSKIKEIKLNVKSQLILSLEGYTKCEKNRKYSSDITFICSKSINEEKFINKPSVDHCKYNLEFTSTVACPVDDVGVRKVCSDILIPHSHYRFNMSPLRRVTNNYLVENQNCRFEINICGRLNNNNKCGENITTICDITDVINPKVYAVGHYKNDKLVYDAHSRSLKLIQHERVSNRQKGKRIEMTFKCNENIQVEDTKPIFLMEDNLNVAHFEVATSVVCIPRMISCEIFTNTARYNLKPLHERIENLIVPNEKSGGKFHLNVCGYLNQYDTKLPSSCSDGKTSACYENSQGKGISIGTTQIGPYYAGNSIILNYTDGGDCKNSLKWSTVIKFTCSNESHLIHHSTNLDTCVYVFHWKSREACEVLFERKGQCMVTHSKFSNTIFNMSYLKDQSFEIYDYEDNGKFLFSICSPLQKPCNGYLDSAVCWSYDGSEKNIGLFNEEIVFDNGKIYMSMEGEKCNDNGPKSITIIRFLCDYTDSKKIDFKKDLQKCAFEFFIHTKHACTPAKKVNCSVNDKSGNVFDLSKLTKLNSNYEIMISQNKKIILNVCHSVINNDINGIGCQFNSGVCLFDSNHALTPNCYKNLGDVNKTLSKEGNKIILEMTDGFYDGHVVSSVIEFVCSDISNSKNTPVFIDEENHKYRFKWFTTFVCPSVKQKREITPIHNDATKSIKIDGTNYTIYICPKKYDPGSDCNLVESDSNETGPPIILTVNGFKMKKHLKIGLNYYFDSDTNCDLNSRRKKINFNFKCGFESQKPKIYNTECLTNVILIDPEVCDSKLECKVKSYDLTPIKGSYVVYNKKIKYFINLCKVGEEGVGGLMELDGKNYSMGYQESSPTSKVSDTVEIDYTKGDYCYLGRNKYPSKYSTKIRIICDIAEAQGEPIFVETLDKCLLEFEWKTSLVCRKKMIDFNKSLCAGTLVDHHKDFDDPRIINMTNILKIYEFLDNATNMVYNVHFCKEHVMSSNSSNTFGNMSLHYDVYKKQLIASFKNTRDSTNMNIIITCFNSTEKLPEPEVLSTDLGTTINTYSEGVCCLDDINHTNEMCKTYLLTHFPTSTLTTTITIEDKLSTDFQNYEMSDKLEYLENSDAETPFISDTEQKSDIYTLDSSTTNLPQFKGKNVNFNHFTSTQSKENNVSSTSYTGLVLLVLILVLTSLIWFYRLRLVKELRKLLNSSQFIAVRRRRRSCI